MYTMEANASLVGVECCSCRPDCFAWAQLTGLWNPRGAGELMEGRREIP
jgi:hypothetical protein